MATKQTSSDDQDARELWLVGELRKLTCEDDFAGTLNEVSCYPQLTRHELSEFERDVRDWGLMYGIAFGLAVAKWPQEPHKETAKLAFHVARMVYVRWGGEIQDPALKREAALRAVVEQYGRWDEARFTRGSGSPDEPMGKSMAGALHELCAVVAR